MDINYVSPLYDSMTSLYPFLYNLLIMSLAGQSTVYHDLKKERGIGTLNQCLILD